VKEYIFGVLSVVWQEASHNGNEEEIINRGINVLLKEFAAEHSVHLTALRRWLAASILFNVVLLAVVLYAIGGR